MSRRLDSGPAATDHQRYMAVETGLWHAVRPTRASDEIAAQLRQAVFDGRLRPGEALGSEGDLAVRFGVSRLSVREALRSLEALGLIEVRLGPRGGPYVAHGDPHRFAEALAIQLRLVGVQLSEVLDALAGLEQMAGRLAAENATPEDLAGLTALVETSVANGVGQARAARAGRQFHEALAEASHNPVVIAALIAVREAGDRQKPTLPEAAHFQDYHRTILEAIRERDAYRAAELAFAHAVERREHLRLASPAAGAARRRTR
jgi:GntR family transcriptional repressor for pyruvate dehydrogenase complex